MTARNTYATLVEFKNYWVNRGGDVIPDAIDDSVIEDLMEQASRYMDSKTGCHFYPLIETRSYSLPKARDLRFGAELLEVISFLNGDDSSIISTQYNLLPNNQSPKFGLQIKQNSSVVWETDSDGESEYVLDVTAIWGYHNRYSQDAWKSQTTLAEALDTSETDFDMTSGVGFDAGRIFRIDNEIFHAASNAGNTVTVEKRGDNGSTAAAHSSGATVYLWQPMEEARNACIEITNTAYHRRFGQSVQAKENVTAAGIVLTPREIPVMAEHFIKTYTRRV